MRSHRLGMPVPRLHTLSYVVSDRGGLYNEQFTELDEAQHLLRRPQAIGTSIYPSRPFIQRTYFSVWSSALPGICWPNRLHPCHCICKYDVVVHSSHVRQGSYRLRCGMPSSPIMNSRSLHVASRSLSLVFLSSLSSLGSSRTVDAGDGGFT